jgi:hypothetical protein
MSHGPCRTARARLKPRFPRYRFPQRPCRRATETLTADDGPHRGIESEALRIVDVFVAGEPTERRLAEQPAQIVARVLAGAPVEELGDRDVGQPEGIVEFAVRQQAAIRRDPGTMEFELDAAIEEGLRGGSLASPVAHPTIAFPDHVNIMI